MVGHNWLWGVLQYKNLFGIPQIIITLLLLLCVMLINIFNVGIYGKVETVITILMMILFVALSICGVCHLGEIYTNAIPKNLNMSIMPEGGWSKIINSTGSAVWFFIGFEFACPMAEENVKPYKNIPYALILGLVTIYAVDSLFAIAAVRYTDISVLRESTTPQIDAATAMLGKTGAVIMVCLTFCSIYNSKCVYGIITKNVVRIGS